MSESAFVGAGKTPGMELWRIESLRPVKQAKVNGKFHTGDSYILLVTSKHAKSNALSHAIHFWLGSETSQDEAGIAAYKTVELDDALGGGPVQYREVQGSESTLFLSYFKHTGGVEYLPGGVESGFRAVERDVWPVRLLHVKGARSVRVKEVPLIAASLNRGDVFVLDKGLKIFLFNGAEANKMEKLKGLEVATRINADERGGRAELILLDDDKQNAEFWTHFGGYTANLPAGESDEAYEKSASSLSRALYRISDATGSLVFDDITPADKKLQKALLDSNDIFLVQSPANKIFLWIGRGSNLHEKKEATVVAVQHLATLGLPASTPIERVSEGSETGAFKSEFSVWDAPRKFGYTAKTSTHSAAQDTTDTQALLHRKAAEDEPLDDGSGKLTVWRIENFEKAEVAPVQHGHFFSGDCYILLYSYFKPGKKTEEYVIYYWIGRDCTADERGAAALLTVELDDKMGGKPVQVRVVQGKEPAHFRQLFKGKMVVYDGGHESAFNSTSQAAQQAKPLADVALFHVRGTTALNTVAQQVVLSAKQLNSDDAFVLVSFETVFVWLGRNSNSEEHTVAQNIATLLANKYKDISGREVAVVREGEEDEDFWALLGGQQEYAQSAPGESAPRDARLFSCSTASGSFKVEEVDNFDQTDLNDEDVYLLDTYTQVFVWVGSQSTEVEKTKAAEFAAQYVANADDGRDKDSPIIRINAGEEPAMFARHFVGWDAEFTEKRKFKDPYAARLEALAAKKQSAVAQSPKPAVTLRPASVNNKANAPAPVPLTEDTPVAPPSVPAISYTVTPGAHSYEALKGALPDGVDPAQKEEYLSDAEFVTVFGVDKVAFRGMPKWKRDQQKKAKNLF